MDKRKNKSRRRKMVSNPKRIFTAITAMMAIAVAPAQSQTRKQSINQEKDEQEHNYEIARNTRQSIDPVPADVIEDMDPELIDFVIAGFPKCGTTYLQNKIFYESEKVFIPHKETHFLANDKYTEFKNEFANVSSSLLAGYKSPFEVGHRKSLRNLQALFPDIKMIITMRHPILQFESLYNYKLRKAPELIPPVGEFVGTCREQCYSSSSGNMETITVQKKSTQCLKSAEFCSGEASFHQYLSRLGLTPMNTTEELYLLDHHHMSIHPFPEWRKHSDADANNDEQRFLRSSPNRREDCGKDQNNGKGRLFLIEIGQLDNFGNDTLADELNSDLETFLGLESGDLPRTKSLDEAPKIEYTWPPGREEHKIDICEDRYKPLRETLLETSRKATKWILEYLLHPSNREVVVVSNMEVFERLLEGWKTDPCENRDEIGQ